MRQMTTVWGIALLSEFALKVVMVETLSTDTEPAISGPLILELTAVLIVVSIRWGDGPERAVSRRRPRGLRPRRAASRHCRRPPLLASG